LRDLCSHYLLHQRIDNDRFHLHGIVFRERARQVDICRAIDWSSGPSATGRFPEDVYFVAPDLHRLWPELRSSDDRIEMRQVDPWRLTTNESTWVVSTYLRLKAHGLNVKIVDRLVPDAINICTAEDVIYAPNSHRAFLVPVQGDRGNFGWGDYTLVQSPSHATRSHTCLIDLWPQPGLLARNPGRGDSVRRIAYLGYSENLAPSFRTETFRKALAALGVDWIFRERPTEWHDYSDIDLCLAVRGTSRVWIRTKPATKLFHAWITGCPALLGREPAYRYWGEPGRDYLEVNSPAEALETVRMLQRDPALYRSIRERGRAKASDHDEDAVERQWVAVISGPIWETFTQWRTARPGTILLRAAARRVERLTAPIRRHVFFLKAGGVPGVQRRLRKLLRVARSR
jgi:glycosyl transferase family 1